MVRQIIYESMNRKLDIHSLTDNKINMIIYRQIQIDRQKNVSLYMYRIDLKSVKILPYRIFLILRYSLFFLYICITVRNDIQTIILYTSLSFLHIFSHLAIPTYSLSVVTSVVFTIHIYLIFVLEPFITLYLPLSEITSDIIYLFINILSFILIFSIKLLEFIFWRIKKWQLLYCPFRFSWNIRKEKGQ